MKTQAELQSEVYVDESQPRGSLLRYGHYTDAAPAVESAAKQFAFGGDIVTAEQGDWILTRQPNLLGLDSPSATVFRRGFKLRGCGDGTRFVVNFALGYAFDLGSPTDNIFTRGIQLSDFMIVRGAGIPKTARAVRLQRAYQSTLRGVWIKDLYCGIELPAKAGDADACSQTLIDQCRIETANGFAVDARAAPGVNENSQLTITRSFFRGNGVANEPSSEPASGGIIANVQQLILNGVLFAENNNASLYLPGGAGLTTIVDVQNTAFENTTKRHVRIMGCHGFRGRSLNLYSNDQFTAFAGIDIDADIVPVDFVDLENVCVRATAANNNMVCLRAKGQHLGRTSARGFIFQNFDHPGQLRSQGFNLES